jgi:hypothetical protein
MLKLAANRPICFGVTRPYGTHQQIFIAVRKLRVSWYWAPSPTREQVYGVQLLLGLASVVFLGFYSYWTHNHILLPQIGDSPILENHISAFISLMNSVAQLYPQGLRCQIRISSSSYTKCQSVPHRNHITSPLKIKTLKAVSESNCYTL